MLPKKPYLDKIKIIHPHHELLFILFCINRELSVLLQKVTQM